MARQLLPKQSMRGFIIFLLVAGVAFVYWRQQHNETPPAPAATNAAAQAKMTPAPLTPAPRGQASEYNWMKRSLDRARDVTEQSRARTQADQNP